MTSIVNQNFEVGNFLNILCCQTPNETKMTSIIKKVTIANQSPFPPTNARIKNKTDTGVKNTTAITSIHIRMQRRYLKNVLMKFAPQIQFP